MRTDLVLKVWSRSRFRGRAAAWSGRSAFEGGWVKRWNLADLIFSSDLLLNLCLNLFSFLHPPLILLSFSFFQFQFALLTWHGNMFVLRPESQSESRTTKQNPEKKCVTEKQTSDQRACGFQSEGDDDDFVSLIVWCCFYRRCISLLLCFHFDFFRPFIVKFSVKSVYWHFKLISFFWSSDV